jgi:hypothetical protein
MCSSLIWNFIKPEQELTRDLTSESLHESFLNIHCLIKRAQELHESWQARVYVRIFLAFVAWSNENKSCMRVDKREFTWEFPQLSLLDQTRTRVAWELTNESLRENFLSFRCLIKREQELHESWQARVYMNVFSTFIAWSNENKSCMSDTLHESFLSFRYLIKREQELHKSWEARVYARVFSTFIAWSNENKSHMRELTILSFHCLIKREQELHERVDKREFTWEFS